MDTINKSVVEKVKAQVDSLMNENHNEINQAYLKFGDKDFTVTFKSHFKPEKGKLKVKTDIKLRQVPDLASSVAEIVDPNQLELWPDMEETVQAKFDDDVEDAAGKEDENPEGENGDSTSGLTEDASSGPSTSAAEV